ncbi:MAG: hypothetical protein GY718_09685 [Lentisphaerae bacterium]|nr:hypothetical protein [Lentisphaerota bacterium]
MDAGKAIKFDGVWHSCGEETILDTRNNILAQKEKQYKAKAVLISLNQIGR